MSRTKHGGNSGGPKSAQQVAGAEIRRDAAKRAEDAAKRLHKASALFHEHLACKPGRWDTRCTELVTAHPDSAYLVLWLNRAIEAWLLCILDGVESCTHLIRRGTSSQVSALASARIALDAASQLAYLLSNIDDDDVLLLHTALLAWQDDNNHRDMWTWAQEQGMAAPDPSQSTQALTAASDALQYTLKRDDRDNVTVLTDAGGTKHRLPSITQLTRDMQQDPSRETQRAWRIASGASHGRPWLIAGEFKDRDSYPGSTASTAAIAAISAASITLTHLGHALDESELVESGRYLNQGPQRLGDPRLPRRIPEFPLR